MLPRKVIHELKENFLSNSGKYRVMQLSVALGSWMLIRNLNNLERSTEGLRIQ